MPGFRAAHLATLLFVIFAAGCGSDSSGGTGVEPGTEVVQNIDVPNVFAAQEIALSGRTGGSMMSRLQTVEIGKIRITVFEVPGDRVLFQKVYDVDPAQAKWTLPFSAPVGAQVRLVVELMSVAPATGATTVEYSGQAGPVTIRPCPCTPIPVPTYPGPADNLGATSVTLSPEAVALNIGQTSQLSAAVLPAGPNYARVWQSLNSGVATVSATGLVTAVATGTAQIVVIVGPRRDTATVTVTAPANTCVTTPHTLGSSANGAWTVTDCLASSGSGRRFDMYEFTIAQQTSLRASVTGSTSRRLSLRRSGTQEYVQVMAGETFMSPTAATVEARYVLAPGSYVFEIANHDAATLGTYTLTTSLDATASCNPLVFVTLGVTINEQLSASDCDGAFGGKEDWFILLPNAGQRVDLTLATTSFAPVLVFRDDRLGPASPTLARDIRSTVGATARVAYTTTFSGFHEIVVNNATAALGSYTLTIGTGNTANTCDAINTSIPSQRLAKWEATDCSVGGVLYDRYPFTLTAQTAVRGTLTGPVNKSLGVFAGTTEVLDWSRAAAGDLTAMWYLAPGQYEFRAGVPAASADSSYSMVTTTTNGDIGCANNATSGNVTFANQSLGAGDCTFNGNEFEDRLFIWVPAGKTISVSMTGNNFSPAAIIRDPATPGGTVIVRNTRSGPGTVTASHTVTTSGYYQVIFGAAAPNQTGTYNGSISVQ